MVATERYFTFFKPDKAVRSEMLLLEISRYFRLGSLAMMARSSLVRPVVLYSISDSAASSLLSSSSGVSSLDSSLDSSLEDSSLDSSLEDSSAEVSPETVSEVSPE